MKPPVSYQGSKTRIADKIIDVIMPFEDAPFFDMCCGNGSISICLVDSGIIGAEYITMVDAGPWGRVWDLVGGGHFSLESLKWWLNKIPSKKEHIKEFMEDLSRQSAEIDTPYVFLLLQASSFGGKAIWKDGDRWINCSFRNYWEPTRTSSRRYPVNPMMPMPATLFKRMDVICQKMLGIHGLHEQVENIKPTNAVVYIDPPYANTTEYGHVINNVTEYAIELSYRNNEVFVSEGKPLCPDAVRISSPRSKGGISGERKSKNEEWVTYFSSTILMGN